MEPGQEVGVLEIQERSCGGDLGLCKFATEIQMSRRMNWQNPYRDQDPTRTDVSKELAPRSELPRDSRTVYDEADLTPARRLEIMIEDVEHQMARIDARIATWRDPELKTPNPGVRESAIAELERRRGFGVRIFQTIDEWRRGEQADDPRRACWAIDRDYDYFLSPL